MSSAAEDRAKREVAYHAVDTYVRPGMCIGLGTGTTAHWAIERVGELVRQGADVRAVPTSEETARMCGERNVPLVELGAEPIAVAIDGADEATADFSLIKGGGGALFREKAVAIAAARFVVIVTERKLVRTLGAFPVPVEVVPFSLRFVAAAIGRTCPSVQTRLRDGRPFVTDNGNVILDCAFGSIADATSLDRQLRSIHGVVATGLFIDLATQVLVATAGGVETFTRARPEAS